MKIMLILSLMAILPALLSRPARINPARLFTHFVITAYCIGIFRLICFFPLAGIAFLGLTFLTVLFIAMPFRKGTYSSDSHKKYAGGRPASRGVRTRNAKPAGISFVHA